MRNVFAIAVMFGIVFTITYSCQTPPKVERFDLKKEKEKLGKRLFFDKRLSLDNTISCGSCHLPEKAFADGKKYGTGIRGQLTTRNVPSILNAKYLKVVMFDGAIPNLERQILVPLTEHNEMGSNMRDLMNELSADSSYQQLSRRIYKRPFDAYVLTRSIAAYERSLVAMNSKYDRYQAGDQSAMSKDEVEGMRIFNTLYCVECHSPPYFTNFQPEDNGLYKVYEDKGRYRVSRDSADIGKFKTPSLRNVSLTGPYMHDGSFGTLEEVVKHYMSGGKGHFNQSKKIQPFSLDSEEQRKLVLFLKCLSDKGTF